MEQTEVQKLIIEKDTILATSQYLQTRPWAEVNGLIAALLKAENIGQETPAQGEKNKTKE